MTITTIEVKNVNYALHEGFWKLKVAGTKSDSRNGPVARLPGPMVTVYTHPEQRVLFNPDRDANPVFHLMEALWMFAGRNDVKAILPFNKRMEQYAESDGIIWGAYGFRWRFGFHGYDQIVAVRNILRQDPTSRRAVIQMWNPTLDLGINKRDVPCNTTIYFSVRHGRLDMTVCCRSNDILWGAYGANAVHMSMLQELLARDLGLDIGKYTQFSNDFHAYLDVPMAVKFLDLPPEVIDEYMHDAWILPMLGRGETLEQFLFDAQMLFAPSTKMFKANFFKKLAFPLHEAYLARKAGRDWSMPDDLMHNDWVMGFNQWASRRENKA